MTNGPLNDIFNFSKMKKPNPFASMAVICLSFLCHTAVAQNTSVPKIASIPFELHWVNNPLKFSVQSGTLSILAGPKTDMFRDPNVTYNTDNAPKLLFTPDSDFIISAGINHAFASKWDGGAIVLFKDSAHWIKFCFEKDYTGAHRVVSVATNNISDDCNSVAIPGNKVYYKMAKAGNVITLYYSTNNKNWFLVRHLQFNETGNLQLGFLAQSAEGKQCQVNFSAIRYQAKRIADPYLGN